MYQQHINSCASNTGGVGVETELSIAGEGLSVVEEEGSLIEEEEDGAEEVEPGVRDRGEESTDENEG